MIRWPSHQGINQKSGWEWGDAQTPSFSGGARLPLGSDGVPAVMTQHVGHLDVRAEGKTDLEVVRSRSGKVPSNILHEKWKAACRLLTERKAGAAHSITRV